MIGQRRVIYPRIYIRINTEIVRFMVL